ncbi:uncharacterized protein LOC142609124 [Castanea sativa]|uniref:uncharacterized protein LOC142609124 n=1 Tax=Castanea sativa TaxID=21020 RepID=UPI003F64DB0D
MAWINNPIIEFSEEDAQRLHHLYDVVLFVSIRRGIEVNLDKIRAIMEMAPPRNVKEVQSLNCKVATLNRFMSREMDKCLPVFCTLKKSFEWTAELSPVGIVLRSLEGDKIECMVHLDFLTTNNKVEYEALVAGLDLAKVAGPKSFVIHYDSQVITNQVNSDYKCKGEKMKKYLEQVKKRVDDLHAKIGQIPKGENEQADRLAKAASTEHMITLGKNTQAYVRTCDKCQRFSNVIRQPAEELILITAPWPFTQWRLDIMGLFPIAMIQLKFLIVGIDYFTKWVEAEALATITEKNVQSFVWKNIIYRYGIPNVLVSDNRK